jgi:hypothetical protein
LILDPAYNPINRTSNVALVRLPSPVTVRPAVLIKPGQTVARNDCYAASYGPLEANGNYPNPLHIVQQPLLCQPGEKEIAMGRNFAAAPIVPAFVKSCTYGDQILYAGYFQSAVYEGPCEKLDPSLGPNRKVGERGAPLQCSLVGDNGDKSKQVLVGIFRFDDCLDDFNGNFAPSARVPSAYTNISPFADFIAKNAV